MPEFHFSERELDCLRVLATRLVTMGRFSEAKTLAVGMIAAAPHDYFAFAVYGVAAEQEGAASDARWAYERAVMRNPEDAASLFNLGRLRIDAGELERGLADVMYAERLAGRKHKQVARAAQSLLDEYEKRGLIRRRKGE